MHHFTAVCFLILPNTSTANPNFSLHNLVPLNDKFKIKINPSNTQHCFSEVHNIPFNTQHCFSEVRNIPSDIVSVKYATALLILRVPASFFTACVAVTFYQVFISPGPSVYTLTVAMYP